MIAAQRPSRVMSGRKPAARITRLLLASLRALMGPEAPIVVATVYDPSDGSGDAVRLGLPPWPQALRMLAELNQALRSLATEHRVLVADVHARFLSHGLAAGDAAQPAARPPDRGLWYCGLIEPNAWGASEIRAAFWETLAFIETKPQSRDRQKPYSSALLERQ